VYYKFFLLDTQEYTPDEKKKSNYFRIVESSVYIFIMHSLDIKKWDDEYIDYPA